MPLTATHCHPPTSRRTQRTWAGMTLPLLLLAGCGGGSSSGDDAHGVAASSDAGGKRIQATGAVPFASSAITAAISTYHVDSRTGDDANDGSAAAPWKTLARVSSVLLKPGDTVKLACGATWRETLELNGAKVSPGVTLGNYGSACTTATQPVISGADLFSGGWTKTGNVWVRDVPLSTPKIERLFVDGTSHRTAQWPNSGGIGYEFSLSDTAASTDSQAITLRSAHVTTLAAADLVGATAYVRSEPWYIEKLTVASLTATTRRLAFTGKSIYPMEAGVGYILADKLWMLDAPGEFFHDTANGKLYVYPSSAKAQTALNASVVEGSVRDVALAVSGTTSLTINGLVTEKARTNGTEIRDSIGFSITRLNSNSNGESGIEIETPNSATASSRNGRITLGSYSDNYYSGIRANGAKAIDIEKNNIVGTGRGTNVGQSDAALMAGDGALVRANYIGGSANFGIRFSSVGGTQVVGNHIENYCQRLTDCAAIYSWNAAAPELASAEQSATVSRNRILAAKANPEGTVSGSTTLVAGVYLDDFTKNTEVTNNVMDGAPYGVFIHNGSSHRVSSNQIYLPTAVGIGMSMDRSSGDFMTGNEIQGNLIVPVGVATGTYPNPPFFQTPLVYSYKNTASTTGGLNTGSNTFSGNTAIRLTATGNAYASINAGGENRTIAPEAWRALQPGDLAPLSPATYTVFSMTLGAELLPSGTFSAGMGNWLASFQNLTPKGTLTLESGLLGCAGNCVKLTTRSTADTLISAPITLPAAGLYQLSLTNGFSATNTVTLAGFMRNSTPFDSLANLTTLRGPSTATGYAQDSVSTTQFFSATKTGTGVIGFRLANPGVPVTFDDVSLRQVTGYTLPATNTWAKVIHASSGVNVTVTCATLGWSSTCQALNSVGTPVPLPAVVTAGTSALFLRADSPWRR
ncbi:MAG TPA: right-handed parallel beta-helix repeat-containing protein [Nitrospira sp.]|nr:right-handed parallel beta-helix repeat-containing protein [Nitrospira sp.]